MNRIDDLKDETIRTLARTLKASGLAASETEAIRMATNMAHTNQKVNSTFEERKEKNIMGLSFLHKDYKQQNATKEIIAEEEIKVDVLDEEPQIIENDCANCSGCEESGCEESGCEEELLNKETSLNELFEVDTKDEFIKQDLISEESNQPETTQEIKTESRPKRDLSQYKESQVDLGDVFRFRG